MSADAMMDTPPTMQETLVDWFETIEEVELSDEDRTQLGEIAESLDGLRQSAVEMGIAGEDFDEWLHTDVLEQWSSLLDDMEDEDTTMGNPVQAFHNFAKGGEQRLYFQMLKWCSLQSEQTA